MFKNTNFERQCLLSILLSLLLSACTYPIKYRLNDETIVKASATKPLNVQVAIFADNREAIEREKSSRKKKGDLDVNDYTYDKEFQGPVNETISKMLVQHLKFSQTFASIEFSTYRASQLNEAIINELAQKGVDAVIVGQLENFYGYYNRNPGKQFGLALGLGLAFGIPVAVATTTTETHSFGRGVEFEEVKTNPVAVSVATSIGSSLGAYLESTFKRNIERNVKFSVKMIGTKTHAVLWEDTFAIEQKDFTAMPGLNTEKRKFEVVVTSLREAVNRMVQSLSKARLSTMMQ